MVSSESILIDEEDYSLLMEHTPLRIRTVFRGKRYVIDSTGEFIHRRIMGLPWSTEIDHINGNTLDNRRSNLRLVTHQQNCQNTRPIGRTSRFKGVHKPTGSNTFRASIQIEGKKIQLGSFADEIDAALAYNEAARLAFGKYAYLNEIEGVVG